MAKNKTMSEQQQAYYWIEHLGICVESTATPDDYWWQCSAYLNGQRYHGKEAFGDLPRAVRSVVEASGRKWDDCLCSANGAYEPRRLPENSK